MSKTIVTAKINAGFHPVYGQIIAGHEYQYDRNDPFPDQLFHPLDATQPATVAATVNVAATETETQPTPATSGKKAR